MKLNLVNPYLEYGSSSLGLSFIYDCEFSFSDIKSGMDKQARSWTCRFASALNNCTGDRYAKLFRVARVNE